MKKTCIFVIALLLIFSTKIVHADTTYPDGCNADTEYSSTTGYPCAIPDCSPGDLFSGVTGRPCGNFIPGCYSTNGYSVLTGTKCDSINSNQSIMENNETTQDIDTGSATPDSLGTIEIVYPVTRANLNIPHLARATPLDETNYVIIGAIYRNAEGVNDRSATMTITTDDGTQDKTLVGTGIFDPTLDYPNGAYYYGYQYDFTTVGNHVITFACNGVSQSITLTVNEEDTRPDTQ